jgi:tripartite tricarboxylate transporter family receptor
MTLSRRRFDFLIARPSHAAAAREDCPGGELSVPTGAYHRGVPSRRHIRHRGPRGRPTAKRSEALPDIPSVGEHVSGYAASNWYGFAAPTKTPAEIISKLNTEINAALTDPKVKARFIELGGTPLASSPADFAKFVADDTEKWAKVIRAANIKPD